jgi:hypothetical protein
MNGAEVCQTLGISRDQRRRLVRRGHLGRRRVDEQGNPCPHDETLEPCSCTWDYDQESMRALGYLGTVDRVPPGAKAWPLPEDLRPGPGTPTQKIRQTEQKPADRQRMLPGERRVRAREVESLDDSLTDSYDLPESLPHLVTVVIVLLSLVFCLRLLPSRRTPAAIQTSDASPWVTYPIRPEHYGLIDTSPDALALQPDRYWQPGSYGFHR